MKSFFNLSTSAMLVVIAIAILAVVLSSTINWLAVGWMLIAAIWVVCARTNQLTAEDWKQLYDTQSKAYNTLRQTWASTNDELVGLRGKYQTLDDKYLKLSKQTVEVLSQTSEAKKTQSKTTRKKKEDYTEQELARIKNEMKAGGLIKEEE